MESVGTNVTPVQNGGVADAIAPLPATDIEMVTVSMAGKQSDPFLVTFSEPFDAENPKCWYVFQPIHIY